VQVAAARQPGLPAPLNLAAAQLNRDNAAPPTTDGGSADNRPEFLVVAQVLGAHGIRGELKCRIVTDFPRQRFKRGNTVVIRGQNHVVQSARIQGEQVLLKLADVADRDTAAAFRGADVEVPTDSALPLPKGQFYWHQVIGLRVEDATTHEALGEVADIIETGANDVYVVKGPRGEILIPAIKDVLKQIDPAAGHMLVQPLPGMLPEPKSREPSAPVAQKTVSRQSPLHTKQ
jgi:16S rRNA processing protein RimM